MSYNVDFATFADYSLSEINTGIKWVDGSYIYKKTLNFGTLPDNDVKTLIHGIANIDYIIKVEGIGKRSTDGVFFQIGNAPNPQSGMQASISIAASAISVDIYTGTNRTNVSAYVTLYYTKTS